MIQKKVEYLIILLIIIIVKKKTIIKKNPLINNLQYHTINGMLDWMVCRI